MDFDPAVFGDVANVAIFSATGDALGYANVSAQHVAAYFSSATAAIGQLPDLPVFVVSIPVLPGVAAGTTSAVTVNASGAPWNNVSGNPYSVSLNPGMLTVGGSLSVQSVTPGGGVLPAGTVLQIEGTGFDQTTTVAIDDVSISSTQFIGPQQINVTLGAQTEMTGKQVHVTNSSGTEVDYFPSLPSAPGATPDGFMGLPGIQPLMSLVSYTTAILQDNRIEQPFTSDALALLNPNLTPITVILEVVTTEGTLTVDSDQSLTIPASTLSFFDVTQLFPGQFDELWIIASAPVRILEYVDNDRPPGQPTIYAAAPTAATASLPAIQAVVSGGPVNWSWQTGTPLPSAVNLSVGGNFSFTVSVSGSAAPFLTVTPQQGTAPSTLSVASNFASATPGTYAATITLTPTLPAALASLTAQPTSIAVTLVVSTGSLISLAANSNCCAFFEPEQNNPATGPDSIALMSNGSPAAFTVTIGACAGGNWLSVTPPSGTTPATLTFTANPAGLNLPGGVQLYQCPITIQGPANTLTLTAGLTVIGGSSQPTLPPTVQVTPGYLTFQFSAGTSPPPQTLTVTTGGNPVTVSVQTQSGGSWLNAVANALPGSSTGVVTVSIGSGLAAGTYNGTVTISLPGATSTMVTVVATVVGLPPNQAPLTATPSPLLLTAAAGMSASASLAVAAPGGIPVAYTASAATSNGGNWLTVNSSGITPDAQFPEASALELAPGVYNGSINIVWGNGTLTVPVIFTVTASLGSPPATAAIVNAASEAPTSIAPGEVISLFGTGLGAAVNGLTLNAGGKVATSLGGTQVLINGVAAPLIYASPSQLNVIVPYEVTGSTIANIQVQWGGLPSAEWGIPVAPSSPAIFTIPENGAGQAAVLNQDNSVNSSSNPAARGTVIQIYATGGGQTSPASSTGSVAPAEANLTLPVTVTIGAANAQVVYAGNAPGEAEGVVQINAVVPQSVMPGRGAAGACEHRWNPFADRRNRRDSVILVLAFLERFVLL